jgi:O-succinylbenzoate synthase
MAQPPSPAVLHGLASGLALYRRGSHWLAHEAWEEAWHAAEARQRPCIQGLIQTAAAVHKLEIQSNPRGALKLVSRALHNLADCPDSLFGLTIGQLRDELRAYQSNLHGQQPARAAPDIGGRLEPRLRIEAVELHVLGLPMQSAEWGTQALLVNVRADGLSGWSECLVGSQPDWSAETIKSAWHVAVTYLIPRLMEAPLSSPAEVPVRFEAWTGNGAIKAGLEAAVWDVWSQMVGLPLSSAVGEARPTPIAVRVNCESAAEARATIEAALEAGHERVCLEIAPGRDRRFLVPAVESLPTSRITLDGRGRYHRAHCELFCSLDALGFAALEQPLAAHETAALARLQRGLNTPLVLRDSTIAPESARWLLRIGAGRGLALCPGHLGMSAVRRIHDACRSAALAMWIEGQALTGIGQAMLAACTCLPGINLASELGPLGGWATLVTDAPPLARGRVVPGRQPGLGIDVDLAQVERLRVAHTRIRVSEVQ